MLRAWTVLAAIPLVARAVAAQQTWRIEMAQLAATVAAAAPGDILLVRGEASLAGGLMIRKPLRIHGEAGAELSLGLPLQVEALGAGQAFVLQNVVVRGAIGVRQCVGQVLIAGLRGSYSVTVEDCRDVTLHECAAGAGASDVASVIALHSSVAIADSDLRGASFGRGSFAEPRPALDAAGCCVRVAHSRLQGGHSEQPDLRPSQPAVVLLSSDLRLSGGTTAVHAGTNPDRPVHAIDGTGSVVLDPAVLLTPWQGAAPLGTALRRTLRAHPTTTVARAPIGGGSAVRVRGAAHDPCWLLLGFPAVPTTHPGVHGELCIGASLTLVLAGRLDAAGELRVAFPVPAIPELRAVMVRWQAVVAGRAATFVSEPATECHF
ncbi:MAG TPA: hypothetical protein VK081_04850 [Planctomycetota bacterium]|nr:hypothetical protein [Planctomycetota bacterium]